MHKITEKRRCFGDRRVGINLGRRGMTVKDKKLHRLDRGEGL